MSNTISVTAYSVEIHSARGKDVLTVEVPRHEIDVLRAIHGGNVIVGDEAEDEVELPATAAAEYARLQRKYRQPGTADPVRYAFPQGPHDLGRFGFDGKGEAAEIQQSSQRKHKKPADKPDEKAKK